MSQNVRTKVIEIVVLIAIAIIAQIIVGALGQVTTGVYGTLAITQSQVLSAFARNGTSTGTANTLPAVNDMSANSLTITLGGTYAISPTYPLTVAISGNTITTYGTLSASVASTSSQTQTFVLTSGTATQTLCASCGNFYNFSGLTLTGLNGQEIPTITAAVTQNYNAIYSTGHASANTISFTDTGTVAGTTATTNFNLAGVSVTTVLSFMSIIFLIAAVVILLSLFGMENLFKLGKGGRD